MRWTSAAVLTSLACAVLVLAAHARSIGARLEGRAVAVGEAPAGAPNPGDTRAFAPFAFGIVGPVEGDAGALARGIDAIAATGEAKFAVLVGDVTRTGSEGEALQLAGAYRDRGLEVVAVPGPGDLAESRIEGFSTHVSPPRWWFRSHECLFVGGDAEWNRKALASAEPSRAQFVFSAEDRTPGARIVRVAADGSATTAPLDVSSTPRVRDLARSVSLGVVLPVVRTTVGYVVTLAVATLLLAGALRLGVRSAPG